LDFRGELGYFKELGRGLIVVIGRVSEVSEVYFMGD